jgi:hypothetical protein
MNPGKIGDKDIGASQDETFPFCGIPAAPPDFIAQYPYREKAVFFRFAHFNRSVSEYNAAGRGRFPAAGSFQFFGDFPDDDFLRIIMNITNRSSDTSGKISGITQ